jgi:hypothetical protein
MNNQIQNAYINALLADAAYVDTDTFATDLVINLTQTQANFLTANFEVASTENKDDIPILGSHTSGSHTHRGQVLPFAFLI